MLNHRYPLEAPVGTSFLFQDRRLMSGRREEAEREFHKVGPESLKEWATKCFSLMGVAWGYIDTILDMVAFMKIDATKPLVRRIRELRMDWEGRHSTLPVEHLRAEARNAEIFEDFYAADFNRLYHAVALEVDKLKLQTDHRMLVTSVYQAIALCQAVMKFGHWVDIQYRKAGARLVANLMYVPSEFLEVASLIKLFAGDCWRDVKAIDLASEVLVNRLHETGFSMGNENCS